MAEESSEDREKTEVGAGAGAGAWATAKDGVEELRELGLAAGVIVVLLVLASLRLNLSLGGSASMAGFRFQRPT